MSKSLCCEYCGTVYDPTQGKCPVCGGSAGTPVAPESPAKGSASSGSSSMDDFLLELGILPDPPKAEKAPSGKTKKAPAPTAKSSAKGADAGTEEFSLEDILGSMSDHDAKSTAKTPESDEGSAATIPVASAPSPRTAPSPKAAPSPKTAPSPKAAPSSKTAPSPRTAPNPRSAPKAGGRFSPGSDRGAPETTDVTTPDLDIDEAAERDSGRKSKRKKGTITSRDKVVCLVLATLVCIVGLFILYRFLRPYLGSTEQTEPTETQEQTQIDLSCKSVIVEKTVTLTEVGQTYLLSVTVDPADTTDALEFSSDAPEVAAVTAEGLITAMDAGKANITITCGNVMAVCIVTCDIEEETEPTEEMTEPTEETTEPTEEETEPTEPNGPESLKLDRSDVTLFSKGESFKLSTGGYDQLVTWSSSDSKVATVEDGKVTAVGGGTARIYARYGEVEAYCIVRCRFESDDETEPTDGDTEPTDGDTEPTDGETEPTDGDTEPTDGETEPTDGETGEVSISHTDVSIAVNESFTLRLTDANGNTLNVTWSVEDESVCTVTGNKVTGVSTGRTVVSCTYNGDVYKCIVRVR